MKNGGPAFPVTISPYVTIPAKEGMTLRDWFAGQALVGVIAASSHPQAMALPMPVDAAVDAWRFADAMLAAREVEASGE